jgi:hypothetical protein
VALVLANVLQAVSLTLAVFLKLKLLIALIAVHVLVPVLQVQLNPNNFYLEKWAFVHFFILN